MRVIAGCARSLPLKTIEGCDTRPTTDRIKETLFNMISPHVPGCRFLDLFSGSGAIAIEALSRGAASAVLVEQNRKAADVIRKNLAFTHLADRSQVLQADAAAAIRMMEGQEAFDIIYMDPPYGKDLEQKVFEQLSRSLAADEHTMIIVEEDLKAELPYLSSLGFEIYRIKEYKTNKHFFIRKTIKGEKV